MHSSENILQIRTMISWKLVRGTTEQICWSLEIIASRYSIVSRQPFIFVYLGKVGGRRRWFTNGSKPMILEQSDKKYGVIQNKNTAIAFLKHTMDVF